MSIQSTSSPQSPQLIQDFLTSRSTGVLATSDTAGNPHAAAIYFAAQEDFTLLFATKTETQKYKNIEENKQVAFAVYDEASQTTVQITGHVRPVDDPAIRQSIVNHMFDSSAALSKRELPPAEKIYAGDYVALCLVPMVIKMAVYARPDSEGDDVFETMLFSGD